MSYYHILFICSFVFGILHCRLVIRRGTGIGGLMRGLATLSWGAFNDQRQDGRPQVTLGAHVCGMRYFFPSVLWHCWLCDRRGIRPVKNWVLVCRWWRFDWRFARLIAPVVTVTTTYIVLSWNQVRNGDILVPAYPGCCGKWLLNKCHRCHLVVVNGIQWVSLTWSQFFSMETSTESGFTHKNHGKEIGWLNETRECMSSSL